MTLHSKWRLPAIAAFAAMLVPVPALAHPHVFADARLEVETSADGRVSEFRNVWRFDEVFSSSIVLDFDEDSNMELDAGELSKISDLVTHSLAEFDYYTTVSIDGRDVEIALPERINVAFQDGQLLMFFAVVPKEELRLTGKIAIGVFDPTMYASLDFIHDEDMVITGESASRCARKVVRPDPDEVMAQNQEFLTEAFFETTTNNDFSKLFATRLELDCK
ncbi:DUF1007 family protein [Hoeflea sp. YIM 152468]|uniref:DUF1007 family protein n=1 Tax=Hoeflea sp. YIM 152468 TaxID=3031759 RepID=UPI0023DC154E|nr:DUF1007 family protein [Hoeflea sp. YIM 152468]MDF1609205.1 DUF1007 family protein [Hoeflea sp. YIM 152468]